MKVRDLVSKLLLIDPNKEVSFLELSEFYDTVLVLVDEQEKEVVFKIRNYAKKDNGDKIQ